MVVKMEALKLWIAEEVFDCLAKESYSHQKQPQSLQNDLNL
jgi:hypothetical protein